MTRRADRLLLLLEQLRSRPVCTAQDLSAALEVSPRTVYRDIVALAAAGVPVRGEAGKRLADFKRLKGEQAALSAADAGRPEPAV